MDIKMARQRKLGGLRSVDSTDFGSTDSKGSKVGRQQGFDALPGGASLAGINASIDDIIFSSRTYALGLLVKKWEVNVIVIVTSLR